MHTGREGAGGIGGLLARSEGWGWGSGGGGGDSEVSKSLMTLTGSEACYGWNFALAADNLTTDPGWVNCTYTRPVEFLRVNLGGEHNISHVAYEPRVMGPSESDGTWNGVYKNYAIYVTDSSSDSQADWGNPVATGTWTWPNLQERKDVTFTPKTGRYVYFARLERLRLVHRAGLSRVAGANEIWVYEQGGGGSGGSLVHSFYHADGNGNVTCMVDGGLSIVGSYKYDPYGRTISSSGNNHYQFSSKEIHGNSGMYYYLYRFYDPNTQRWLNRDPIGLKGGINLYGFTENEPINAVDALGLFEDGFNGKAKPGQFKGHSDFCGGDRFNWTKEDHGFFSSPYNPITGTQRHFQDPGTSLSQVWDAIASCDKDAFEHSMHRLQDNWAHYRNGFRYDPVRVAGAVLTGDPVVIIGESSWNLGHLFAGPWPDQNNDAWQQANNATCQMVKSWDQNCGCKRK